MGEISVHFTFLVLAALLISYFYDSGDVSGAGTELSTAVGLSDIAARGGVLSEL